MRTRILIPVPPRMPSLAACVLGFMLMAAFGRAEDGYQLWLRYASLQGTALEAEAVGLFQNIGLSEASPTFQAIEAELRRAGRGLLGREPAIVDEQQPGLSLLIGTLASCRAFQETGLQARVRALGPEGFLIEERRVQGHPCLVVAASEAVGALYGTFELLKRLQTGTLAQSLPLAQSPHVQHRLLNHWDNLDRTVERGYAGFSIWDWHKLPHYRSPRYLDYARANASIGINGTVLTNVNANALVLTPMYLEKVAALADAFRPYGLKVYLTARFSAPAQIGGLETADPLNPAVRAWWKDKVDEIYRYVPDFGGFLVKANSEGQPGPQDYGRSHAQGANMLAEALAPHGGVVMWRAFVYSHEAPDDRAKQAGLEFEPLDGAFLDNVFVQVKNGPIDFQPREPFHPLFGAMPQTPLALELQITQEYLGQGTHLVYLAPMYKECLEADTYAKGKGSTVGKVIDGSLYGRGASAMAGVSNIGTDRNWTGHLFGQANWYAFGRLAWDHTLSSEDIATEWIQQTFGREEGLVKTIRDLMMQSHEAVVNYMTPLGLHHIMGMGHHYGPGPWVNRGRPDWTSVYYHQADSAGIGFDRSSSGSDAVSQYAPEVANRLNDPETCPQKYLLWFHHLPWDYALPSGNSLWEELCLRYDQGVAQAARMQQQWASLEGKVDAERFSQVATFLAIQHEEAQWWKNACLLYFQQFSKRPFPASMQAPPEGTLAEYQAKRFPYAPGIRPRW